MQYVQAEESEVRPDQARLPELHAGKSDMHLRNFQSNLQPIDTAFRHVSGGTGPGAHAPLHNLNVPASSQSSRAELDLASSSSANGVFSQVPPARHPRADGHASMRKCRRIAGSWSGRFG